MTAWGLGKLRNSAILSFEKFGSERPWTCSVAEPLKLVLLRGFLREILCSDLGDEIA